MAESVKSKQTYRKSQGIGRGAEALMKTIHHILCPLRFLLKRASCRHLNLRTRSALRDGHNRISGKDALNRLENIAALLFHG
jgi:hypothetical protein